MPLEPGSPGEIAAIRAQAHLHHAYLLGLQLMVATRRGPEVMGDWMFRLFRRQHEAKFLSSFAKLGLEDLPDAVACARYHALSNSIGGVGVECLVESDRKAWVRFRYPRWMYHGPTICGVPVEVSRGFLEGWYAQNGVSLGNPRLRFVCVSEDMTGEFGLCGYFEECEAPVAEGGRLLLAKDLTPPSFADAERPAPPAEEWNPLRLEKANRNYALEYIRNGLCTLAEVIGPEAARELGGLAARLIGLQYFQETAAMIGVPDGGAEDAAAYLEIMFQGMGDPVTVTRGGDHISLEQSGLRAVRGLEGSERELLLDCWRSLWIGAMQSRRQRMQLEGTLGTGSITWRLEAA
jgi:hypothetical protein